MMPPPPPLSTATPLIDVLLGVHPAKAEGSVQDATAEHLIEAFEELPKKDQIVMVKKLLRDALREDEANETMVLERAPEVKISKSAGDERAMDGTASSSSSSTMNEREILERAVRELPNARPEQRAKAAEILRRLEEETGKVRGEKEEESASTKNASYDASNSGSSSRLENNRFNDFEKEETEENDDNPFEDEDIVWDLRSAVASLTTVAKAKLIPPLAFGTGFAALAFVLTKMVGGNDAGNETRDEARMNDKSDARISPPPPPSPSTIMNDRNDNDAADIAPPLLPMEEAKRLLFEGQAIQPPPTSTTTSKTKKMKKNENRGRGVATNTTSSGGNSNSVLWKRKEEKDDALLEAAVEEEDEDIEEPFEDDDDEPERGEEAREMSPPPQKSTASGSSSGGVKKQRRPPPDLTSASFLSEEDREKNFENIRARPSSSDEKEGVSENGLLLVNYVGKLKDGTVFDTTYGGEIVSTSENSVSVRESETQPVVINLSANAVQPGQVKGLKRGLIGAKRGETKEIMVKAEDGFGSSSVVSPLRVLVPAESELFYTVEVLRVSNTGVDDLFKGVSLCSVGVANKTTAGCSDL
ncbi:unnamed protein product [Bathycoccus prasinos]